MGLSWNRNLLDAIPFTITSLPAYFALINRDVARASHYVMRLSLKTSPIKPALCTLDVVAARKFGNPDLKVPEGFEDAARGLVAVLKRWRPGIPRLIPRLMSISVVS